MQVFFLTILLGAFLLFQVQPVMGRFVLPWFGGGPSIWTTTLLFFQALLLGGYLYAHLLGRLVQGRKQVLVHGAILGLSLAFLPIIPEAGTWRAPHSGDPSFRILHLLGVTVGLPYFLLSSTGPLVQRWFHLRHPQRPPYRLYALSNAGSLLALLSYPVLVEPHLTLNHQAWIWSGAYVFFAAGSLACCIQASRTTGLATERNPGDMAKSRAPGPGPGPGAILLWLGLAASGTAMLMAVTNQISLEVSVVPFLWVIPLSLYLVTFIIAFEHPRGYDRRILAPLLVGGAAAGTALWGSTITLSLPLTAAILCGVLFVCCMTCHGELARSRPHPRHLTLYYLVIAAGGALGGAFVALLAPRIYPGFWEFPTALGATCTVTLIAWLADGFGGGKGRTVTLGIPLAGGLAVLFWFLLGAVRQDASGYLSMSRNFYGVLRISESGDLRGVYREMEHGRVSHGMQYLNGNLGREPTTYYGPRSGIGLAIRNHPHRDSGLRIGVIGLGTGTLAAYLSPADTIRFYEIDPAVIQAAWQQFSYLSECPGMVETELGDARIVLEREVETGAPGRFDILAVDAFSSGSVPVHLLTAEAADLYGGSLRPGGILALHVSNEYLDLVRVGRGLARHLELPAVLVSDPEDLERGAYASDWLLIPSNPALLGHPSLVEAGTPLETGSGLVWTDSHAGLWSVLTW